MTLIVMINADFSWTLRVYHNHLRHLRSIMFVVYFFRVTLMPSSASSGASYYLAAISTPNFVSEAKNSAKVRSHQNERSKRVRSGLMTHKNGSYLKLAIIFNDYLHYLSWPKLKITGEP
jgi:hypothetical protein